MKYADILQLIRLAGLLLYFFIAAQGAFYHVGFGKALYQVPAEHFIEMRKVVDPAVRGKLKAIYLSALAVLLLWIVLEDKSAGFRSYMLVVLSLMCLVADIVLIVRFSEPVNELINSDLLNSGAGYTNARADWLRFILIRGYLSVSGFVLLLLHLLLKSR